ncbi:RrF2 family transcriptional regulator [Dorea sp. D27]|uniref:RrF2 family transcriptional regulator n=1 Tax=Dorea sp. D27 TaxID=658665 RepID=UPI000673865F|nr:Rrf2 family transcriptional regulator [Dorea sp. D27]KMZ53478.1 Rrf2 family protein [Dorea sp. D27]
MKISTKGIYALEIAADLAMHSDPGHLESLKNIAERRKLSEKYLERIVKALKTAGIVSSVRGAQGGYCLAKDPEQLTVREVLEAVEGELVPVECLTKGSSCGIDCSLCPTKDTWGMLWDVMVSVADGVTVSEIVRVAAKRG